MGRFRREIEMKIETNEYFFIEYVFIFVCEI